MIDTRTAAKRGPQQDYDEVAAYFAWMDEKWQEHVAQERYNHERNASS